jgi:hypothetical protein
MNRQFGRRYSSVLCALAALLCASTFARAQYLYNQDWAERFNNSQGSETEDCWVANSYKVTDAQHLVAISFPIADAFTNQPISAFIYQGFDTQDPTAGGGLILLSQTDTTITTVRGDIVTITLNPDVFLSAGDIFYAAVMIPGVPGNKYPYQNDRAGGSGAHNLPDKGTKPFGRSFFDVGLTPSGPFDVTQQVMANITVFGGVHPVMGGNPGDVNSPGNLALWVKAVSP